MRTARPLGLDADGRRLIVVVEDDGEELAIPADERLRAALRNDRPRLGQLEIDMDSALRPRDIQARIRAGESLEEVAQAAGVPVDRIEPFAAPVIAEREHIAGLAQTNPVRRAGDAVAHRGLRTVVTERLLSRGVDVDSVVWDAWRNPDRRWTVRLSYESGSAHREADFTYDQTGRFSVAANEDARWLTGEHSSSHGPQPGRASGSSTEQTRVGLDDELAIVRAIQPQFEVTPDIDDDEFVELPDDSADTEDAFAEGELAEVDGVLDIVPGDRSNLDVLYDMLSSFDEDSVQIYAGLIRPAGEPAAPPVLDQSPAAPAGDEPTPEADEDAGPAATGLASDPERPIAEPEDVELDFNEPVEQPAETAASTARAERPAKDEAEAAARTQPADPDEAEELTGQVEDAEPAQADEEPTEALLDPAGTHRELDDAEANSPESSGTESSEGDSAESSDAHSTESNTADADDSNDAEANSAESSDAERETDPLAAPDPAAAPEPAVPPGASESTADDQASTGASGATKPGGRRRPEPEQPRLVDEAGNEPSRPVKRKRATVPSWDEIMFGSPKPKP